MKYIQLKNEKTIVDDDMFLLWGNLKWHNSSGYVKNGKGFYLHRLIMGCPKNLQVDHINGNGLDNRRQNLRICTHHQNQMNQKKHDNCSSAYKGVSKNRNGWMARLTFNGRQINLGRFLKERYAAMVHDIWAKELQGDFANLNF